MILLTHERQWRGGETVVAFGMFDGVHEGHAQLMRKANELAALYDLKSVVYTFSSHPMATYAPEKTPPQLETRSEKIRSIAQLGIDAAVLRPFDRAYAAQSPEAFVQAFVDALHPKHVVIGFNYSFGRMGAGKAEDMRRFGEKYGFETHVVDEVQIDGLPVSSTRVRAAIAAGEMEEAARLLGRPYALCGVIQRGKQLGRKLDFPTANLLWPEGKVPNYDNIAAFVNAGIRAVRKADEERLAGSIKGVCPQMEGLSKIPVMIHLDNGGNNALYREWFDNFTKRGEDFELIGLSYYPFWHGSLQMLNDNMNDIAKRYGKDLIVAEVSMGYTMDDYKDYEKLADEERKGYATKPALVEKIEYPMTVQGQYDFMEDFLNRISHIDDGKGKGFFYWEPAWIPVPGSGWATPASLKYIQDPGPCGNEWANQALFDYEGNALPTLKLIRDFKA